MRKRQSAYIEPYSANPNIEFETEVMLGRKTAVPGDLVKFKGQTGYFVFRRLVRNTAIDKEWIDCLSTKTREMRSFYADTLKEIKKKK